MFIGSEGRLNCETDAVPPPTFEWFHADRISYSLSLYGYSAAVVTITGGKGENNPGGRYKIFSNGTLIIAYVMQYDEGEYTCKATNSLGSASATADANVRGK